MFGEIAAAVTSVKALSDLFSAAVAERDTQKRIALELDFSKRLLDLQGLIGELQQRHHDAERRVRELEHENDELKRDKGERDRYELSRVGPNGRLFAYSLKPESMAPENAGVPSHYLCQPCFDAGKKSVLVSNGDGHWHCNVCGVGVQSTDSNYSHAGLRVRDHDPYAG